MKKEVVATRKVTRDINFGGCDCGRRRRVRSPAGGPTRSPTQLHVTLGHWLATDVSVFIFLSQRAH